MVPRTTRPSHVVKLAAAAEYPRAYPANMIHGEDTNRPGIGLLPNATLSVPSNRVPPLRSPFGLLDSDFRLAVGLKQSMSQRICRDVPRLLDHSARSLSALLAKRFESGIPASELSLCVLDESLASRAEFTFPPGVFGNHRLSYLGDSMLTSSIAAYAICNSASPKEFQTLRTAISSRKSLCEYFDHFMRDNVSPFYAGPITWDFLLYTTKPTASQKAEFVEALLGALVSGGHSQMYHRVLLDILDHRFQCQPDLPLSLHKDMPILSQSERLPCHPAEPSHPEGSSKP